MLRREMMKGLLAGGAAGVIGGHSVPATSADEISKSQDHSRSVRFAHLTDVHVSSKRSAEKGLAQAIRHVHALSDRPEFILNGGDAIYDALETGREEMEAQWGLWKQAWKENGTLPVRNCLGNHDIWGWNKANSKTNGEEPGWGKQVALDHLELERPYYRFDQGNWRFIVLDSMTYDEETAYLAVLDQAQLVWLQGELKGTSADMPVVVVSHIPILTVGTVGFSSELRKHPQGSRMLSHQDGLELLMLFRQYPNIKLCLSGHTHLTEEVIFGDLHFVNSGAVSGLWWKGNFLHTAEGYNVIDLYDDGTYTTEYMTYGWHAQEGR